MSAAVWVKIPTVEGGEADQHIKMYWGNSSAQSESDGSAVFDAAAVWHLEAIIDEEFLNDATGNENTASNNGAVVVDGIAGKAIAFNGTSDFVTIPDNAHTDLGASNFTIEVTFKTNAIGGNQQLVCKRNDDEGQYQLQITGNKLGAHFGDGDGRVDLIGATELEADIWNHAVLQREGGTVTMYLNGNEEASVSEINKTVNTSTPLYIGKDPNYGEFFNGDIEEVGLYKMAQSKDWIDLR